MALFKKRRPSPDEPGVGAVVGFTSVIITRDKFAYVNQQHHVEIPPDMVAEVATVSWALWAVLDALESGDATTAKGRLRALLAVREASVLNARVNPGGLIPNNPPDVASPQGVEASAMIRTLSNGRLTAVWSGFEHFKGNYDALLRVFAALWTIAERRGSGLAVWHGLHSLLEGEVLTEVLNPRGLFTLPGELLEVGARQSELESGAEFEVDLNEVASDASTPTAPSSGISPRDRLVTAMEAISELVDTGTIDTATATEMRDRAMERYESSATSDLDADQQQIW